MEATSSGCRIDLESWPHDAAARVWADRGPAGLGTTLTELGELLARLVDNPDTVNLVVPISMPEAVQRREPHIEYTAQRGSGVVGARTMQQPDGQIDIILNPAYLHAVSDANAREPALALVRRTIVHEAQHVTMRQRGSGFDEYVIGEDLSETERAFAYSAVKLCDEHRAEWQATQPVRHRAEWQRVEQGAESVTVSDVADVLEALGQHLADAHNTYQAGPRTPGAVGQLLISVLTACNVYWTALGYWMAYERTSDADIREIAPDIASLPLWERYVGDTWERLREILRSLPVEDLTTRPEILTAAMEGVAGTLRASLATIGFDYVDEERGSCFYINRFDFPTA